MNLLKFHKSMAALAVAVMGTVSSASALSINVVNFSFEDDVAPVGGVVQSVPTGWTAYNRVGGSDIGSQNPNGSQFSVNNPLAFPAEGNQFMYVNTFADNPGGISGVYQTVGSLEPNTLYTLTVAIGSRADRINTPGTISLVNGNDHTGTVLATGGGLPALQNTWEDYTISFATGASVSGNLTIVLSSVAAGTIQADFDNVRLEAVAVPEPEVYGMCLAGLIGLVLVQRLRSRRASLTA